MEQKLDIQQLIKDTVAHSKNAFFSENSQLASHILDKMRGHIEKAVDDKIKPLNEKIDKYIEQDSKDKEVLAQTLKLWKEDITPVIEMGKSVQGFGKVSLYILGFVASVSAGFYALMAFLKKD